MKINFLLILSFLISAEVLGQEIEFTKYTYSELFKMIAEEQDSIFRLQNAIILYNHETDNLFSYLVRGSGDKAIRKDTIYIDKEIEFKNVCFPLIQFDENGLVDTTGAINHIVFNKRVRFENSIGNKFDRCTFKQRVWIAWNENMRIVLDELLETVPQNRYLLFEFKDCKLERGIFYSNSYLEENNYLYWFALSNCIVGSEGQETYSQFQCRNQKGFELRDNEFKGTGRIMIIGQVTEELRIERNNFGRHIINIEGPTSKIPTLNITKNQINNYVFLDLVDAPKNYTIDWEQFSNRTINMNSYDYLFLDWEESGIDSLTDFVPEKGYQKKANNDFYFKRAREEFTSVYREEAKLLGTFHQMYKSQYDTYSANLVYNELKDLETKHFGHVYRENPSFKNYFTWKVNQFLKVFSAYGTEPARAIVYSVYVIFFFGFIYLFFPNSWDSHGRRRIMDRFRFFTKYMNKNAGIHEVYLEENKEELLESEDFKNYMLKSEKSIPKFFINAALPLYKWSVSGTRLSASILKRVDIMKGTWSDLPKSKRTWKTGLLIGGFSLAIIYDLFIKVLNALMLSINTFTTLGFGEIPIKGLPRYLAIIQGFIGWFMLTIFSVSLISQLLN